MSGPSSLPDSVPPLFISVCLIAVVESGVQNQATSYDYHRHTSLPSPGSSFNFLPGCSTWSVNRLSALFLQILSSSVRLLIDNYSSSSCSSSTQPLLHMKSGQQQKDQCRIMSGMSLFTHAAHIRKLVFTPVNFFR